MYAGTAVGSTSSHDRSVGVAVELRAGTRTIEGVCLNMAQKRDGMWRLNPVLAGAASWCVVRFDIPAGVDAKSLDVEGRATWTNAEGQAQDASIIRFVNQMMTEAMGDVDAKTRECFEEVLTEDALRSVFTKMFSGKQDEAGQELIQPMMECAAPDLQDQ